MIWQHWVNFVLAVWVIVSAYVFTAAALTTDLVVTGIVMAVLALWGALQPSGHGMARHAM